MNSKMFKKIMYQANEKVDASASKSLIANTIKIFQIDSTFYAYQIDKDLNKTLILETENEKVLYKTIVKHLGIKLDKRGDVLKTDNTKKRS